MECIIYIRWSTAVQARGSSLERQTEDCRRHAEHKGWNVKDTLCDDGVSAYSGEHVQQASKLARFLDDAEAGKLPEGIILLTERLDRLSRQGYDELYFWMKRITAAGVILATVDGDKEYRPGRFALAEVMEILIKAEVAHDESAKKASRLAAAWKGKRRRLEIGETFVMTARAPAWLRVEGSPRRFAVIPERAEIVRRIYEDTANGLGKATIARDLNREGVATFGRATGWHSSYVQKILAGTTVLGEMQPGSKEKTFCRRAGRWVLPSDRG
jgi:DNA invertase Pin-like site-specific DNA recombinase